MKNSTITTLTGTTLTGTTFIGAITGAFLLAVVSAGPVAAQMAPPASIAVTQIVEHPALDAARQGVLDDLEANGYKNGDNLTWTYESAQGNPVTAKQIADKFVGESPDVILAIATPSAQAIKAATEDIPLVFTAITAPVEAGLVDSMARPGGNATGTSDLSPVAAQLEMIRTVVPGLSRLGVVYNPGEVNSVVLVDIIKSQEDLMGFRTVEAAAINSASVIAAARSLVGRADAIYVPTDNTVVSALEAVTKVGRDAQLPVFAADTDSVNRGAVAAAGFDYYDLGLQTGVIMRRILNGEKPANIPVELAKKTTLHVNLEAARAMGVTIPDSLLTNAVIVEGQ